MDLSLRDCAGDVMEPNAEVAGVLGLSYSKPSLALVAHSFDGDGLWQLMADFRIDPVPYEDASSVARLPFQGLTKSGTVERFSTSTFCSIGESFFPSVLWCSEPPSSAPSCF